MRERISSGWLSDDVARGLAAMWPPLKAPDVTHAADELTAGTRPLQVVAFLRGHAVGRESARSVVEALQALRILTRDRHSSGLASDADRRQNWSPEAFVD
jgi:hypothetical protein